MFILEHACIPKITFDLISKPLYFRVNIRDINLCRVQRDVSSTTYDKGLGFTKNIHRIQLENNIQTTIISHFYKSVKHTKGETWGIKRKSRWQGKNTTNTCIQNIQQQHYPYTHSRHLHHNHIMKIILVLGTFTNIHRP